MAKTFVAYARDDAAFALKLVNDLRSAGADVWIDQLDIAPGEPWDRAIQQALRECAALVVVLSPAMASSENVMDEVNAALDAKKLVLPVLRSPCDIPYRLKRIEYIDFSTLDYDTGLFCLLKVLHGPKKKPKGTSVLKASPPDRTGPAASPAKNRRIWICVVPPCVIVAAGILIAMLIPPPRNATKSPPITIGFCQMGPGGDPYRYIGKHYEWAKEAIAEELRVFRVSEDGSPPPPNMPGEFVKVLVGCYKTYQPDVNEVWVRIEHDKVEEPNLPPQTYETKGDIDSIKDALRQRAERIAPEIRERILKAHPLRGLVKEVDGTNGVYLDIGHDAGVLKGDQFEVFKALSSNINPILVTVEETEPDQSFAVPSFDESRGRLSRVRKGWCVTRHVCDLE
jgi:hypothetical protein